MHVIVLVLLVIYVLGLLGTVVNRAWAPYGPYFNLVGALLLIIVVLHDFPISGVS